MDGSAPLLSMQLEGPRLSGHSILARVYGCFDLIARLFNISIAASLNFRLILRGLG